MLFWKDLDYDLPLNNRPKMNVFSTLASVHADMWIGHCFYCIFLAFSAQQKLKNKHGPVTCLHEHYKKNAFSISKHFL